MFCKRGKKKQYSCRADSHHVEVRFKRRETPPKCANQALKSIWWLSGRQPPRRIDDDDDGDGGGGGGENDDDEHDADEDTCSPPPENMCAPLKKLFCVKM